MKIRSLFLFGAALFLTSLTSNASITDVNYAADGDGAVICPSYTWPGTEDTLSIYGDQYWGPAHILGNIFTDTAEDPTLTIASAIDNDTDFSWTDYHVNIHMTQSFTIVPTSVSVFNDPVGDWTPYLTQQPVFNGTDWVGKLDFYAGTALPVGNELDFSYAIHFLGNTHYSFTQEMMPTPEPGTLSLLLGGVLLLGRRTAKRQ